MFPVSHPTLTVNVMSNSQESQDFELGPLYSTMVALPQAALDWAAQIIQSETNAPDQWQSFLRALALKGFEQWVEAGALDVAVYYNADQIPPTDITCRVGEFRLCLVVVSSLSDEVVQIPSVTVEHPQQFAHLYVLVEVREEEERVIVLSGLRRDRLLTFCQTTQQVLKASDTYTLPVHYFDSSPEELLLYLNCLNPEQLSATASFVAEPTVPIAATTTVTPPLENEHINVGRWLQDQIGELADRLAWTLLPPIAQMEAAVAIRSPDEEMNDILTEISSDVTVPPNARGAYVDQPMGLPLRLYAFTWHVFETEVPEWSLLLCLGPSSREQLPAGTRLLIQEGAIATTRQPSSSSVLVDQTLEPESESTYLYGQVVGTQDELFTATVELPNGRTLNWPPFMFRPQV
ncbi:MAG: DUF1822 family protein [Leptolyngbyaceae cyanobacterium]